ncbi:hypothetical protein [Flavobacterium sp.]|uniref:hypothetical protein n=1 Tax=Flavobacterium sp. TaxID=239 RepID=UPI004034CE00
MQRLKYFILLLPLIAFFSCKREATIWDVQNDTIIVYDTLRYNTMRHDNFNGGKVKLIDTARINGEKRAIMDARKGMYSYYFGAGHGTTERYIKYIKSAFGAKGIRVDFYYVSCRGGGPLGDDFGNHSYMKTAKIEFEKKYGKTRIDSMRIAFEELTKKYYGR